MLHVKEERITIDQLRARFNNIPSVQTLVDIIRAMQFLGKLLRDKVKLAPRQLLIAFCPETRPIGRPLKCNKESLHASLKRLMEDIPGIHIDSVGSLKDFYLDALDDDFWAKCINRLRDPSLPIPERPNRDASFNPRRSTRNRGGRTGTSSNRNQGRGNSQQSNSQSQRQRNRQQSASPPSPRAEAPRGSDNERANERPFDPEGVGRNLYDSLKILGLTYSATLQEVKTRFRANARIYHPDQHRPERTGLTAEEATKHFLLLNNAYEYLRAQL